MTAADLQALVAPLGVFGIVMLNADDPTTWTFQGGNRAAVIAAIQNAQNKAPAVSQFWPAAQTALERDVASLKTKITGA